jgi:hypothetical protein
MYVYAKHICTQVREPSANVEHEASTSKIGEDQLFYFQQRGVEPEKAVGAIISGFCREVRGANCSLQRAGCAHAAWDVTSLMRLQG